MDSVLLLLSQSLTVVAGAAEHTAKLDAQFRVSAKLKAKLDDALERASSAIADASVAVRESIAAATGRSSPLRGLAEQGHFTLGRAYSAMQELRGKLAEKEVDFLHRARAVIVGATDEIGRAYASLRTAPLSEMPIVASLEALGLARVALAVLGAAVASNSTEVRRAVVATLDSARARAGSGVWGGSRLFFQPQCASVACCNYGVRLLSLKPVIIMALIEQNAGV